MSENFIEKASEERGDVSEETFTLDEFFEFAQDNPNSVSDSVNYLLSAIEHFGKRTILEDGEEKERYCFFDDPYGDGEHAILGNTDELNEFVDELRRRASEEGDNDKIIWFLGPTATGKSELKRCLINGLKGFAESEEGAKYTLEWTLDEFSGDSRMAYGDGTPATKSWYKSPININPVSILPESTREEFLESLDLDVDISADLDPFSQEAMDMLEDRKNNLSDIAESNMVRARRYHPEVGDGIGVLHSEDNGNPKQKLAGSWMQGAMEKFAKRGQKNPQAFSYDGVLSQGNGLISIVEDAGHHSDVLDKMLNVCEEEMMKLDNKIAMDLDTLIVVFSNPDLESQLEEYAEAGQHDPLRALRRRLDKYEFNYLTTLSLEGMLIRRLLTDSSFLWDSDDDRMERVSEPLEIYGTEVAPRVVEAAAMYEIITRLEDNRTPLSPVEQALLLENRIVETEEGELIEFSEFDYTKFSGGEVGIPVTYTVDILVEAVQEQEEYVLPEEILDKLADELDEVPVFNDSEADHFRKMRIDVKEYILDKQEDDVLEAMVGDIEVTEDDVREYIDGILAWQENEEEEYDDYELKEFETRYLGQDGDDYFSDAQADVEITQFRRDLISPINKYMWDQRDEDFTVNDVPISESPPLEPLLEENDWDTVSRIFPDANLSQWENPPSNTETEELKEKTVKRMVEMQDYSGETAEAVSKKVVEARDSISKVLNNGS